MPDPKVRPTADAISHLIEDRDIAVNVALVKLSSQVDAITEDYKDLRTEVGGVGRRIDELASSISAKIETTFQSINIKLEEKGKPNWQALLMAAGFVGAAFFAFISPMEKNIDRIQLEHAQFVKDVNVEFTRRNDIFVTAKEHNDLKSRVDTEIIQRRDFDKDLQLQFHRLEDRLTVHAENDLRKEKQRDSVEK